MQTILVYVVFLIVLNSQEIDTQIIILSDLGYLTSCTGHLLRDKDKFRVTGYFGPRYRDQYEAGWNSSVTFQIMKAGTNRFENLCTVSIGPYMEYCNNTVQTCYCPNVRIIDESATVFATFIANITYGGGKIRGVWSNRNGTVLYSYKNLTVPLTYESDKAILVLSVNGYEAVEIIQWCGHGLIPMRINTIKLCCTNAALPCYPRISLNGSVVADNNSPCVTYEITPEDENYVVNLTKSYSMCFSSYITTSSCIIYSVSNRYLHFGYPSDGSVSVTGDEVFRGNITMICKCGKSSKYLLKKIRLDFNFKGNTMIAYVDGPTVTIGRGYHRRLSLGGRFSDTTLTMGMVFLQSFDEKEYTCLCQYDGVSIVMKYSLKLRFPVKNLDIKIGLGSEVSHMKMSMIVPPGITIIRAQCSGDVGMNLRAEKVKINWMINRNCLVQDVAANDDMVGEITNEWCTQANCNHRSFKQTLTVKPNKNDYHMAISCSFSYENHVPIDENLINIGNGSCIRSGFILFAEANQLAAGSQQPFPNAWPQSLIIFLAAGFASLWLGLVLGFVINGANQKHTRYRLQVQS